MHLSIYLVCLYCSWLFDNIYANKAAFLSMPAFVRLLVQESQCHHLRGFWKAEAVWDREVNLNELNNGEGERITNFQNSGIHNHYFQKISEPKQLFTKGNGSSVKGVKKCRGQIRAAFQCDLNTAPLRGPQALQQLLCSAVLHSKAGFSLVSPGFLFKEVLKFHSSFSLPFSLN